MRIALLTTEFVSESSFAGGLANYIHRVSRLLRRRGHEVHVVTASDQSGDAEEDGVFVHHIPSGRLSRFWPLRLERYLTLTSRWVKFSFQACERLRRLHAERPLDVVQSSNLHGCGLVSSYRLPIPQVVRISSHAPLLNEMQGRAGQLDYALIARLEAWQVRRCTHLFAPSARLAQIVEDAVPGSTVEVIPTPFFVETTQLDESLYQRCLSGVRYLLFFAARLATHKGPQVLAEALPRILDRHRDLRAVFIGRDQPYASAMMSDHVRRVCSGWERRLLFFDVVPHASLYPIIANAEIVVLPSLTDNLPNACLEAMGLGAVVVGTTGCSFDEVIEDRVSGFLVQPNDPAALAESILEALDSEDRKSIASAARERIEAHRPERTVPLLESFYRRAIEQC